MKNRKRRISEVIDLIQNQPIGSQEELLRLLAERGYFVTQATLSRDLKMLRVTKTPTERGTYMFVLPDSDELQESSLQTVEKKMTPAQRNGIISISFSRNMVVIKTRNGYAPGLAHDIDFSKCSEILGTIPGANTVFAVLREDVTRKEACELFKHLLGVNEIYFK